MNWLYHSGLKFLMNEFSGELASTELPPIEDLQITVPEAECFQVHL
jgi:hypothetical protein